MVLKRSGHPQKDRIKRGRGLRSMPQVSFGLLFLSGVLLTESFSFCIRPWFDESQTKCQPRSLKPSRICDILLCTFSWKPDGHRRNCLPQVQHFSSLGMVSRFSKQTRYFLFRFNRHGSLGHEVRCCDLAPKGVSHTSHLPTDLDWIGMPLSLDKCHQVHFSCASHSWHLCNTHGITLQANCVLVLVEQSADVFFPFSEVNMTDVGPYIVPVCEDSFVPLVK